MKDFKKEIQHRIVGAREVLSNEDDLSELINRIGYPWASTELQILLIEIRSRPVRIFAMLSPSISEDSFRDITSDVYELLGKRKIYELMQIKDKIEHRYDEESDTPINNEQLRPIDIDQVIEANAGIAIRLKDILQPGELAAIASTCMPLMGYDIDEVVAFSESRLIFYNDHIIFKKYPIISYASIIDIRPYLVELLGEEELLQRINKVKNNKED